LESFIKNLAEKEEVPDLFPSGENKQESIDDDNELKRIIEDIQAKILVVGVGGAGNNVESNRNNWSNNANSKY